MNKDPFIEDLFLHIESLIEEYNLEISDRRAFNMAVETLASTILNDEEENEEDDFITYRNDIDDFFGE